MVVPCFSRLPEDRPLFAEICSRLAACSARFDAGGVAGSPAGRTTASALGGDGGGYGGGGGGGDGLYAVTAVGTVQQSARPYAVTSIPQGSLQPGGRGNDDDDYLAILKAGGAAEESFGFH